MNWSDLLTALGLAIAIEGVFYALAPDAMKRALLDFFSLPLETRRLIGLCAAFIGVLIVWIARS